MNIIDELEKDLIPLNDFKFNIGDQVDVHYKIKEGNKERIQIFTGTVISKKGKKNKEAFTVRKVVDGIGVSGLYVDTRDLGAAVGGGPRERSAGCGWC